MKSIECSEFTQEIAQRDIEFCLANANSAKIIDFKGEFFRKNPHFYINGSDNVILPVSSTVKEGDTVLAVGASGDYMLDSILSYIDNIDATYEDGMDLYNNFVFSI